MARRIKINKFDIIRGGKIVDCVLQSLLLFYFFYSTDHRSNLKMSLMYVVVSYLLFSSVIQLLVRFKKKRKLSRYIILAISALWFVIAKMVASGKLTMGSLNNNRDIQELGFSAPETILLAIIVPISFWYLVVNFRETRYLYTLKNKK